MISNEKRALAYVRSATVDGATLDAQSAEILRLAHDMGRSMDPADVLGEVASGVSLDRPVLAQLRLMAETGQFDELFVCDPARLSRDAVDLLALMREFEAHGIVVHFVQDPADFAPPPEFFTVVN